MLHTVYQFLMSFYLKKSFRCTQCVNQFYVPINLPLQIFAEINAIPLTEKSYRKMKEMRRPKKYIYGTNLREIEKERERLPLTLSGSKVRLTCA